MQIASEHELFDKVYVSIGDRILKTRLLGSFLNMDGDQFYVINYQGEYFSIPTNEVFYTEEEIVRFLRTHVVDEWDSEEDDT